ncbi:hypothetical protein FH5T_18025 [Draconibacterium orientale]|uniref:Uncharacterized protein n=1 Tax=Draconibacterium orientale TaxID=1168034 RepID=A0ABN4D3U5_9BACT|nr:hypothetical protein FH5T_18025 [Draconibacterium orientale]
MLRTDCRKLKNSNQRKQLILNLPQVPEVSFKRVFLRPQLTENGFKRVSLLHQVTEEGFKRIFARRQINRVDTKRIFSCAQHIAGSTKHILTGHCHMGIKNISFYSVVIQKTGNSHVEICYLRSGPFFTLAYFMAKNV